MLEKVAFYLDPYFKKKIDNKMELHNFFNKKIIRRYLRPYIFLKIKKRIKYVYNNSEFYNTLFKESNLKPSDIKTYQDISKIPFTTSLDILKPERFFCVSKNEFVNTFKSSGTTGKPKITHLTENDVKEQIDRNKIGLKLIYGLNQNDTVRILNPPRYAIFFCTYHALKDIGTKINYLKERLSPEQEYKILKQKKVSAIIGDPFFFYSISSEMSQKYDLADLGVRKVILGSEPLPEAIRKKLEEMWNADVFNVYGMNEIGISIAGECEEKNGMHVTATDFYVEVIDPKSGKKLKDGEKGEIVFTTINKEGMPLIRYRTKDFGNIVAEECKCGFPFERIKIESRMDDMILIGFAECL
jgi:phenylacetate-CoA ligase